MKSIIKDPYKVSHKIYIRLIFASVIFLIISLVVPSNTCVHITTFCDVIKNLSYGCIASTLVAWLIDCANVRNLNKKANNIYSVIYADLKFKIAYYIGIWSELCVVVYKEVDYHQEKKTWKEWYTTVKENYNQADEKRQAELLNFFCDRLEFCVDEVNESIEKVSNQKFLLSINDLTNSDMDRIISDFKFEFHALKTTLPYKNDEATFWSHMDAISEDIEKYIDRWVDISYYNHLKFMPYKFHVDKNETVKAILLSDGIPESKIDSALDAFTKNKNLLQIICKYAKKQP